MSYTELAIRAPGRHLFARPVKEGPTHLRSDDGDTGPAFAGCGSERKQATPQLYQFVLQCSEQDDVQN